MCSLDEDVQPSFEDCRGWGFSVRVISKNEIVFSFFCSMKRQHPVTTTVIMLRYWCVQCCGQHPQEMRQMLPGSLPGALKIAQLDDN